MTEIILDKQTRYILEGSSIFILFLIATLHSWKWNVIQQIKKIVPLHRKVGGRGWLTIILFLVIYLEFLINACKKLTQ